MDFWAQLFVLLRLKEAGDTVMILGDGQAEAENLSVDQ